jgi:hypothetical protein
VAVNVGQTLLQHAKKSQLEILGKPSQIVGHIQLDVDAAALRKTLNIPAGGGREADFIQKWGMQEVRDGSRLSNGLIEKLNCGQKFGSWLGAGKYFQIHFDARQILAQAVMQFAGKLAALLILHLQQARGEMTQRFFALASAGLGLGAGVEFGG